jgi:molybdate-binding protein/DNA-binding transcriptional regulator YhcF (GntR family)
MDDQTIYQKIADTIRQEILAGELKPGDKLPTVRVMAERWGCTVGTVQHAYQELARIGLVTARPGHGTHVADRQNQGEEKVFRRASLIHRAEGFLLEMVTAGYTPGEIESALRMALDHWRVIREDEHATPEGVLRFAGSHDLIVTWLAAFYQEMAPKYSLELGFSGSLGGLISLAEGKAEIAGSHLWDDELRTYNVSFVRRLLPGKKVALVTLAFRRLGWIVRPGNPKNFAGIQDLLRPDIRFLNRNSGSGTRVRLDAELRKAGCSPSEIQGYGDERDTHSEIAREIAEDLADVGFGLEASGQNMGLSFLPFVEERYDLVIPEDNYTLDSVQNLLKCLHDERFKQLVQGLAGYDLREMGKLVWIG